MNETAKSELGSISRAIEHFCESENDASQLIWERYFERIRDFANGKIYPRHRRVFDGEDVAGSALLTLMDGLRKKKFPNINNREQLWQVLIVIATRKTLNNAKYYDRQKRGGGKVKGGSAVDDGAQLKSLNSCFNQDEDPAKFIELELTCQELLNALPDDDYRQITLMRLAGFNNDEIGKRLGCSRRTIDRKLDAIRLVWSQLYDEDDSQASDENSTDE